MAGEGTIRKQVTVWIPERPYEDSVELELRLVADNDFGVTYARANGHDLADFLLEFGNRDFNWALMERLSQHL